MDASVKVRYITAEPHRRVLVTSDIHGHSDYLKAVLRKANFGGDDLLIVVGDLLEKGPDSLGTLRYVMALAAEGRALTVWGNVDYWRVCMLDNLKANPAAAPDFLAYLRYMREWKGTSLYDEMCRELGDVPDTSEALLATLPAVEAHCEAELAFLRAQPTVIEAPHYRFVHGGLREVDPEANLSRDPHDLMKFDDFLRTARRTGMRFDKYTVVGHWPVSLNHDDYADSNPIIDPDTRIIAIDGGCGLKPDGQLNLLILPSLDCGTDEITHIYYDDFPTMTVSVSREESTGEDSICLHWGDCAVRILALDRDMAEVEHVRTGHRLWVPADFLYNCPDLATVDEAALGNGIPADCRDCSDYRLPVRAGDVVSVIKKTTRGILAKKDGVTGWVELEG